MQSGSLHLLILSFFVSFSIDNKTPCFLCILCGDEIETDSLTNRANILHYETMNWRLYLPFRLAWVVPSVFLFIFFWLKQIWIKSKIAIECSFLLHLNDESHLRSRLLIGTEVILAQYQSRNLLDVCSACTIDHDALNWKLTFVWQIQNTTQQQ